MKRIVAFVVTLVLLAGITPVQAQGLLGGGYWPSSWESWYYYWRGDRVHMLQREQIDWVAETLNIDRRSIRPVTDDLAQSGPYVGLQGSKGFYPLYQCSKGQRWRRGIGTALLAGGVGYIFGHTTKYGEWEGVLTGLGVGTGLALYLDANKCGQVQNSMVVIDDPSDLGDEDQSTPRTRGISGRENGWNEILRARQEQTGTYQRGQIGGRPVNNRTGLDVILWVGDSTEPLIVGRGGHEQVPRNPGGLKAETIETTPGGYEVRRPASVVPNHDLDGWDIVVPAGR